MTFFERRIPGFLTDRKNTIRQLVFTAIFALVFINLYAPFGVDTWFELTQAQLFFYSSLLILTGLLIIAISRIVMLIIVRKKNLSIGEYIGWLAAEILSLAIVYMILQRAVITAEDDILTDLKESFKITVLVLLFPYTLSFLYFSWMEKNRKLAELSNNGIRSAAAPVMIAFRDEKGELRFSVKTSDFLYLEAADNYVEIHYMDGGRRARYMIRNTLKNMEKSLAGIGIVRCHRSYMVHFERVRIVRRERDGLVLELDTPDRQTLPISRTYVEQVMKLFSGYTTV
jgi:DNA-binding LytR/AlgR family response regulator